MKPKPRFARLIIGLLTGCFTLLAISAAPITSARADSGGESLPQAVLQANGIVERTIDGLWKKTDDYWHKGDYSRIIALIRLCVSADPSFVEAYGDGAWVIWSMGDTPAADALLADGTARSPAKAEINYEFGFHLFNTKRYSQALPYLRKAADAKPADRMSLTTLAHCYRYLGRYDDSIAAWREVIKDFPDFGAGPSNLARVEALKRSGPPKASEKPSSN